MQKSSNRKFFLFRWIDYSSDTGGIVAAICLLVVTFIVVYEVFMRYIFNAPTTWVQEMSIYLCMAIGFLGAAYALKNDSHFSITVVVDRLNPRNRRRLKIVTDFLGAIYSFVFIFKGMEMVKFAYDIEDVSTGLLAAPLWIPWLLVPVGGLLLTLQFINKLADDFSNRPK
ncbi:MAG: hypothetical protein VR64_10820 [Desulfatitalea sp. BRH_c12]|nr:MAG: hypothetical protein VR64_10820 [Desulfatitalea sp. BRH_c12]